MLSPFALAALVFAATLVLIRVLSMRSTKLLLDLPNHRSLHERPTPKVGGLAMMTVGLAAVSIAPGAPFWALIVCAALLLAISALDDARNLSASVRLTAHALAVGAFLAAYPAQGWLFNALAFATFLWMLNLYNFMDGADGLAGGMTLCGFGALAIASYVAGDVGNADIASLALVFAMAAAAFLCFNFPPASVFMGDAGSVPLGFLAAAIGYLGYFHAVWPYWFPALVFSPFILDATYTLLKRALRRERIWVAHREHVYQRLILSGWSHRRLALVAYGIMCAVDVAAIFALRQPRGMQIAIIASVLLLQAMLIFAAEVHLAKRAAKAAVAKAAKEAHR
jgi:UDP-N-acetylmuramyl pentapeptide phosphotransferase/UDP-N-acetylglucosamine-1-phosphate transferase